MPADLDLCYLPATEALARFRRRELSPVELMEATLARADAVEPVVNAFTWRFADEAMVAAKEAEWRYLGRGPAPGPLAGLPVAIKEEMAVAGQPCTSASLIQAHAVATHTAPVAQRVLDAGGIVHARTTQPEFACAGFTHSLLFGVTRNPWNPAFDVGGSSGGSAAALAAGTAALAGGSDIGGSIRIPASCCGVVGFKPPYGRVPEEPPYNLDHYCHEGPLARTVADCALFENVVAGPHPNDIASLRDEVEIPTELGDVRGWKIALSIDLDGWDIDPVVAANTRAVAEALRDAGATVEEVAIGWDRAAILEAVSIHYAAIFGPSVAALLPEHRERMTPYAVRFGEEFGTLPPGGMLRGLELEGEIYARLGALLAEYRLLLCPTLAIPALPAGHPESDLRPDAWGLAAAATWDHLMTVPFNICSRCPVLSVPSGFSAAGVPTGVQLVGRTYADADPFHAGAAIEARLPWHDAPERRPRIAGIEATA
ncbi:MAG: amidase [Chloroflexia bacterium]|nr:amidase [Chloroflexia bacterium]